MNWDWTTDADGQEDFDASIYGVYCGSYPAGTIVPYQGEQVTGTQIQPGVPPAVGPGQLPKIKTPRPPSIPVPIPPPVKSHC